MAGDIADVYLRFDGFTGECNDLKHPGGEGWITIKSFSFGFGFQGKDSAADDDEDQSASTPARGATQTGNAQTAGNGAAAGKGKKKKKKSAGMKSGPLTFDRISFSKSSDAMSHSLMEACHKGEEIPQVELECCRYGGGQREEKLPFLHLTFDKVNIKSIRLSLATEGLPTEEVEFEYKKVEMKCLWTDNATGNRLTSQPIGAGWDLQNQEEIDEEPPDDSNDLST